MKRIVIIAAMMLLVGGMPCIAEETETSAPGEAETSDGEKTTGEDYARQLGELKEKTDKLEARYQGVKEPDRALTREHERFAKAVKEQEERASKQIEELKALQAKQEELLHRGFEFTVVPAEQRMRYIEEGKKVMKKVVSGLEGRAESKQMAGMELFCQEYTKYQGLKEYEAAKEAFLTALGKHIKRWKHSAETIRKAREKKSADENDKMQQADERGFRRMAAELKEKGKDIQKDLFVPVPNNLQVLEALLLTAEKLEKSVNREKIEGQGETEEVLTEFWKVMDETVRLMTQGELEEAEKTFRGSDAVASVRAMREGCLSGEERENIQKQVDELRTELNERRREAEQTERYILRQTTGLDRISEIVTRQIESFESSLSEYTDEGKDTQEGEDAGGEDGDENPGKDTEK